MTSWRAKSTRGKRHSPKVKLPELTSAFMTLDSGIFEMEQYHEIFHYYKCNSKIHLRNRLARLDWPESGYVNRPRFGRKLKHVIQFLF